MFRCFCQTIREPSSVIFRQYGFETVVVKKTLHVLYRVN